MNKTFSIFASGAFVGALLACSVIYAVSVVSRRNSGTTVERAADAPAMNPPEPAMQGPAGEPSAMMGSTMMGTEKGADPQSVMESFRKLQERERDQTEKPSTPAKDPGK